MKGKLLGVFGVKIHGESLRMDAVLPPQMVVIGGLVREMGPLISGKSSLVKYYNLASCIVGSPTFV